MSKPTATSSTSPVLPSREGCLSLPFQGLEFLRRGLLRSEVFDGFFLFSPFRSETPAHCTTSFERGYRFLPSPPREQPSSGISLCRPPFQWLGENSSFCAGSGFPSPTNFKLDVCTFVLRPRDGPHLPSPSLSDDQDQSRRIIDLAAVLVKLAGRTDRERASPLLFLFDEWTRPFWTKDPPADLSFFKFTNNQRFFPPEESQSVRFIHSKLERGRPRLLLFFLGTSRGPRERDRPSLPPRMAPLCRLHNLTAAVLLCMILGPLRYWDEAPPPHREEDLARGLSAFSTFFFSLR